MLIDYGYDTHGRPKTQTTAGGATTTLGYDSISRVNEINQNFNGTARDLTLGFAYNPASQLVEQNVNNGHFVHLGQTANRLGSGLTFDIKCFLARRVGQSNVTPTPQF